MNTEKMIVHALLHPRDTSLSDEGAVDYFIRALATVLEQHQASKEVKLEVEFIKQADEGVTSVAPKLAYATAGAAGIDVIAMRDVLIMRAESRVLVPLGFKVAVPAGYELQVRPRSGLALKNGITVLNSPGTIDSDYRGEVGVMLINHDRYEDHLFKAGDRIAQLVLCRVVRAEIVPTTALSTTERGAGGFGSTGK